MTTGLDIFLLSLCSLVGNVGVALTGFGMAIIYLFVWQIAVLCGYESDFKFAVFIQAIALIAAQPLLIRKAQVWQFASRRMLKYFVPVTLIFTPLGQMTGDRVSTGTVEMVGGFLVSFVALFEIYQKRDLFREWLSACWKPQEGSEQQKSSLNADHTSHASPDPSLSSDSDDKEEGRDGFEVPQGRFEDDYTLVEKLGDGQYAVVMKCIETATGVVRAVKSVTKWRLSDLEASKLEEEIAVMQELSGHNHLLALHKVYDEPRDTNLVMELVTGGDLFGFITRGTCLDEAVARNFMSQMLEAISFMHTKSIAHRDLKPENVLLANISGTTASIKIADFGFAKKEVPLNSFRTMCGTASYVAPEILQELPYGKACDIWSLGVTCYIMLAGYAPFRGDTEGEVRETILEGSLKFDPEYFSHVSKPAKDFLRSKALVVDPKERAMATQSLEHPWFKAPLPVKNIAAKAQQLPVFFMIGSQRSGSNWLRTMLDQREDLAAPHPPHVMRDFTPILMKFGDLSDESNFRVMADHAMTFVERNQVPWTDKHNKKLTFPRKATFAEAQQSCDRVRKARAASGNATTFEPEMYLLSVFDAIMNYYSLANGKGQWMCKSMGMSKFHDLLLEFYGVDRLRYIYLVRDPRDVAMSFMKTPVGDCHYYSIAKKWAVLQGHAMRIVETCPKLIKKVHYEQILLNKAAVVKEIYEFIGERRFGGIKRQASVMCMNPTETLIQTAKDGREAQKAKHLSYQFKNLGRGESFAQQQLSKWKDPVTGLSPEDLEMIENLALAPMTKLGYRPQTISVTKEAREFTDEEVADFLRLNEEGKQKMNADLKTENPGDFHRRLHQSSTLELLPELISEHWESSDDNMDLSESFHEDFLSADEIAKRTSVGDVNVDALQSGIIIRWCAVTQRGYYPNEHDKPNQDALFVDSSLGSNRWFAVYDGHGPDGHHCATMAATRTVEHFKSSLEQGNTIDTSLHKAHTTMHKEIIASKDFDSVQSGTTATTLVIQDDGKSVLGNVGDSTCLLGSKTADGKFVTHSLCKEHTLDREDERKRVELEGGVVMTVDERDGVQASDAIADICSPLRIWSPDNAKFPGCGFTRSLGDEIAHQLGVIADPEVFEHVIQDGDVLILASDGLTEFVDIGACVRLANTYAGDPSAAAQALVSEASKRWIEQGDYMDDISVIVIFANREPFDVEKGSEPTEPTASVSTVDQAADDVPLSNSARFWTLLAGATSGFLGGLCGIRGPPIIVYFLHTPAGVNFDKQSQRATGAAITFFNVLMRIAYYLFRTFAFGADSNFEGSDWGLYVAVILASLVGVYGGSKLFERMKDSKQTIRGVLTLFLVLCGASLLISSFTDV